MDLARSSIRTGRRRRLTGDEPPVSPPRTRRRRKDERYALVLRRDGALPVGRFSPFSKLSISLSLLAGLACSWLVSIGHLQLGKLESMSGLELPWLDLNRIDSLATWMCTVSLWLCVGWAAFLYQLRRHRIDDYRGRYRLWVWLAVVWGLASFDVVVGMHDTFRALASRYLAHGKSPVWASTGNLYLVIGLPLGIRLWREIWECRTARFALAAAIACYGLALVPGLSEQILKRDFPVAVTGIVLALPLWGNWLVWTTCATFARHIRLEMEGRSRQRGTANAASVANDSAVQADSNHESETNTLPITPLTAQKVVKPRVKQTGWWGYLRFGKSKVVSRQSAANTQDRSRSDASGKRESDEARGPLKRQKTQAAEQKNSIPSRVAQETIRMREEAEDENDNGTDMLHLSKAERKKLRREQRKFRDAA